MGGCPKTPLTPEGEATRKRGVWENMAGRAYEWCVESCALLWPRRRARDTPRRCVRCVCAHAHPQASLRLASFDCFLEPLVMPRRGRIFHPPPFLSTPWVGSRQRQQARHGHLIGSPPRVLVTCGSCNVRRPNYRPWSGSGATHVSDPPCARIRRKGRDASAPRLAAALRSTFAPCRPLRRLHAP